MTRPPKEKVRDLVSRQREMLLISYAIHLKKQEIQSMQEEAQRRLAGLAKAQSVLRDDAARFDAFLKDNNLKTMEAAKKADTEIKAKLDKLQEIRKLGAQVCLCA